MLAAWKVAPALAAGNAVLLKPAGLAPLTAVRLAQLAEDCGVPKGCVQTLIGAGSIAWQCNCRAPGNPEDLVHRLDRRRREILERSARWFKRLTLELGGKSANLIFADARLDSALDGAVEAAFANAGQDCCARSRIFVERSVYDEAVGALAARIRSIRVGEPLDQDTEMGPLISSSQRERVLGYVAGAIDDGAEVICGGRGSLEKASTWQPTLLARVTPEMAVMREEIFGPVVAIHPFDEESEAVALANDTEYGLSASVWTRRRW